MVKLWRGKDMRLKSLNILLVEDNHVDAKFLKMELAQNNGPFQIHHVETLGEAIRILSQRDFDAMFIDLALPDSLGMETFIRAHEVAPNLRTVVMSEFDDAALAVDAVGHGAGLSGQVHP
jgi:DNA-binding NtrC family response regulator